MHSATDLLRKLNYKNQQNILCLDMPVLFGDLSAALAETGVVQTNVPTNKTIDFALVFVTSSMQVETIISRLFQTLGEDAVLWFCYPKSTTKNNTFSINRDHGWESLGSYGLEPVRQVALDPGWSALRFRKVGFIRSMKRSEHMALSDEAKARIGRQKAEQKNKFHQE
jgi:hypothetical protein